MQEALQNTARRVLLKAFLSSDHTSEATGKTIAVTISKNGGGFTNPAAGATNATEIGNGWYYVDLAASDMNTLGEFVVRGSEGTIDKIERLFWIVPSTNRGITRIDVDLSTRATPAQVNAECDIALADYDAPTNAEMEARTLPAANYATNTKLLELIAQIIAVQADLNNSTDGLGAIMAAVTNLTGNVRSTASTPKVYERPDSGSKTYRTLLHLFDSEGNYEDPDSNAVTVTAQNDQGTDRSVNLSVVTRDAVGRYRVDYTVAATHNLEGITLLFAWTEGGKAQGIPISTYVAETTAETYTAADRNRDDALAARATEARLAELDPGNLPSSADSTLSLVNDINAAVLDVQTTVDNLDIPTVLEIDAQLSGTHGSGLWGSTSSGIGAYTVDINVKDSEGNNVENANVSLHRSGDVRHGKTDVNGNVSFNSDAVTWTVSITAQGFVFTPVLLAISGNTDVNYALTTNILPLPDPGENQVLFIGHVFDEYGSPESEVSVYIKMMRTPPYSGIFDKKIAEYVSDEFGGIAPILFKGATYLIWRGESEPFTYEVSLDAVDNTELPPILGEDESDPCKTVS